MTERRSNAVDPVDRRLRPTRDPPGPSGAGNGRPITNSQVCWFSTLGVERFVSRRCIGTDCAISPGTPIGASVSRWASGVAEGRRRPNTRGLTITNTGNNGSAELARPSDPHGETRRVGKPAALTRENSRSAQPNPPTRQEISRSGPSNRPRPAPPAVPRTRTTSTRQHWKPFNGVVRSATGLFDMRRRWTTRPRYRSPSAG